MSLHSVPVGERSGQTILDEMQATHRTAMYVLFIAGWFAATNQVARGGLRSADDVAVQAAFEKYMAAGSDALAG
jgi:hypothetical protein